MGFMYGVILLACVAMIFWMLLMAISRDPYQLLIRMACRSRAMSHSLRELGSAILNDLRCFFHEYCVVRDELMEKHGVNLKKEVVFYK